jgi:hypothetical protein
VSRRQKKNHTKKSIIKKYHRQQNICDSVPKRQHNNHHNKRHNGHHDKQYNYYHNNHHSSAHDRRHHSLHQHYYGYPRFIFGTTFSTVTTTQTITEPVVSPEYSEDELVIETTYAYTPWYSDYYYWGWPISIAPSRTPCFFLAPHAYMMIYTTDITNYFLTFTYFHY